MATGVEVGTAYVNIVSSTKGFGKNISKELNTVGKNAGRQGREAGHRLLSGVGTAMKGAAAGVGLAAGAAIGAAIVGGVRSAVDQQTAERVLGGLYGSGQAATKMMDDLRKVSSSSPIQYSAYTRAAEALAYAGVEGDSAVSVLENVGHAITATGGTAEHMDRATASVTTMVNAGKVSLDSLQQLSGSGVPIISGLAEHFGVSMEDINKMASEGAIGLEDVVSVMENATGDSFQMSLAGSEAAAGSFGNQMKIVSDNITTAIGAELKPVLEDLTPMITDIGEKAAEAIPGIAEAIKDVVGWLQQWGPLFLPIIAALGTYAIVMGTVRLAIAAWQAAQILLNAAMAANPVGLIIAAIVGLIAAVVLAYNNVEWFRVAVDTAWAWIKNAIDVVVQWFVNTAWPWMQQAIQSLGDWFTNLYVNYIKPAWDGIWGAIQAAWNFISPIFNFIVNAIKTYLIVYFQLLWTVIQIVWKSIQIAIQAAWQYVIKPIWDAIVAFIVNSLVPWFNSFMNTVKVVWSAIQTAIQWAWRNIIKPIWDAIVAFLRDVLAPRFQSFQRTVKRVWDNIKSAIRTVWHFIRDNVFDPLKTAITETVPNAFETGKDAIGEAWEKLKDVAKAPVKFVIDTVINKGVIDNFNKIADIFDVDPIDHVSLPSGFASGGWTGAGSKYKPAGIVHADEFVVQKSSRRRFERENPGALDYLNRTGRLPAYGGYAGGGRVGGTLWDAAQWWIQKGARASRHSWFNGGRRITSGHSRNSYHYRDLAVDFNKMGTSGTSAAEQAFFDRHIGEFQSLFPGIRTIWRAPGHYDHLHIDTSNGANMGSGSAGGGGMSLDFLTGPFTALKEKITEGIPGDGWFSDIIRGGANDLITWPVEWIKDNLARVGEMIHSAGEAVGSRAVKESVRQVAMLHGWGFGQQWRDLDSLITQESSWNPSAANPTTSARGLFQKMTSIHGPVEGTPYGQAQWGLKYIKDRYGSPSQAWAFHKRNNWYADGGLVKPTLYDKGGTLQPGTSLVANKTRKPEYILPAKVTDALMNGTAGRGGDVWNIYGPDPEQVSREIVRERKKREALSGGVLV